MTFIDNGSELKISKKEYLPKNLNISDFVKKDTPDSVIKKYSEYSSSSYELVYVEGNIEYKLFDTSIFTNSEIDNSFLLGNSIEFIWNGKHFERMRVKKKE